MISPDIAVLRALCNLEHDDDFKVIQQWFLDSAGDKDRTLREAESGILLHRAQGASKELREFCSIAANPREIVRKLQGIADNTRNVRSAL